MQVPESSCFQRHALLTESLKCAEYDKGLQHRAPEKVYDVDIRLAQMSSSLDKLLVDLDTSPALPKIISIS